MQSQKLQGGTSNRKNPSTPRPASALMVGQKPRINHDSTTEREAVFPKSLKEIPFEVIFRQRCLRLKGARLRMKFHSQSLIEDAVGPTEEGEAPPHYTSQRTTPRTLALQDDLDHLLEKLEDFKWNVIGLCETKRKGEGLMELIGRNLDFTPWQEKQKSPQKQKEWLSYVRKNFKDYIEGFCKHSDRKSSRAKSNSKRVTTNNSSLRSNYRLR
ncbi:hypothetical protein RRG08_057740 [Elysia crispata]|uniref:Uncharacterized protein n=1 Tax=Elysia crispata TaxID=231223 RepID=A0AAE1AS28_9GAST|nr:hypothetical protein RRG08_057740 [Elysia crispata]